ncbi:histidine kinase, partial [bacterium]
ARDTTERKINEQVLKSTMLQLERSNRELQDFASIASHDLQEPLRAIQAFGDRLQSRHGSQLDEQGHDYLSRVIRASDRMRSLIQDLLAYSRVTTKTLPFTTVELDTVTHAVLTDLSVRVEESGGRVEVGELPTLEADALQMRQLLQNLIANGLKFHRDGEPPLVKVYAREPDQEVPDESVAWTQLVVEDNGIGLDLKFAERIFSPFERLHTKNKYAGTGIGLAICRKIVERHGGTIVVESIPGQGSKFLVTLPVQQPEMAFEELAPHGV